MIFKAVQMLDTLLSHHIERGEISLTSSRRFGQQKQNADLRYRQICPQIAVLCFGKFGTAFCINSHYDITVFLILHCAPHSRM
jgi:hypothetical protein